MSSAQDHKRAGDGDTGLNTGGMGNFSPSPFYTEEVDKFCKKYIYQPTVDAMAAEGRPFKGVIFFGLMLTPDGPKVLEYNARFGDPEAQVVHRSLILFVYIWGTILHGIYRNRRHYCLIYMLCSCLYYTIFYQLTQLLFCPSSITCVNSMNAFYIPIAKAKGFTTHWIILCSNGIHTSTTASYSSQISPYTPLLIPPP